ncbi:hypothetical protein [Tenggerimyces flavus]|uniref:Uncharacterized protein n=1 Tax=Tenggerimyces flavus TaxID=1708749 RepID=A0ABV7YHK4_9ACTN|nr:hypothetical protein [Tenggerimyces flavus]MBM7784203.1 hypothetical protein [Tenggerimyces flavus]
MLKRKLAGVVLAVAGLLSVGLPAQAATTAIPTADQAQAPSADSPDATAINYLVRYATVGSRHRVTTSSLTYPGVFPERGGLWGLYAKQVANTKPLFECRAGASDHFVSLTKTCEGHSRLATLGYIFKGKPTQASVLLYRCSVRNKADHFVSVLANCEGQKTEGQLGYALRPVNYIALNRFNNGPDHWITSFPITGSYKREGSWFIALNKVAKTVPIYSCKSHGGGKYDHFLSRHSNCEGKTKIKHEGYLYTYKAGSTFAPLYRCILPTGDRFESGKSDCEKAKGVKREGLLGWVRWKMW